MRILPILLLLFTLSPLCGQTTPCPCCNEAFRAFDFWVGDWEVVDTSGTIVGENTIEKLENGCVLTEHWRGASGSTGRSFNHYNYQDSTWNQTWMDNAGRPLVLKGTAVPGVMTMRSTEQTGRTGAKFYNEITWTANEDGTVTQKWDIVGTDGTLLQVAFLGIYRRKE
ncbi:hypothetical protein [Neolewinella persica]|uniref:hypothetical protein n=1 Tax=Neolewinella persica TaxID=70998 RepID=UPI0003813B23|nr:hypothetical protein [Neolewinella persica]